MYVKIIRFYFPVPTAVRRRRVSLILSLCLVTRAEVLSFMLGFCSKYTVALAILLTKLQVEMGRRPGGLIKGLSKSGEQVKKKKVKGVLRNFKQLF